MATARSNYRQPAPLPSPFDLLVECCRWTFAGDNQEKLAELAQSVGWDAFAVLAARHRVEGLVWHCLQSLGVAVPAPAATLLAGKARAIAGQTLRAAAQSQQLKQAFDAVEIDCLFVKGLTLAALAYPSPFIKMAWDIDLLVGRRDLLPAAGLLHQLGYSGPAPADLEKQHRRGKESLWLHRSAIPVELHHRLQDHPWLIPAIDVGAPRQQVEVAPGIVLPTLANDELFAYLCVHGASSAWFRLKWITDFAALLHAQPAPEIERLYARSQLLGAGRAAAQALLLSHRLYGTALGKTLHARLRRRGANRWLARAALGQLLVAAEPTQRRGGTMMIHLTQLFLLPGSRFKLSEGWRQVMLALHRH